MSYLTEFIVNFGDVVELDFPLWDLDNAQTVLAKHPGWTRYQAHKPNNRWGLSVTSLNGGFSGEPDLYSLREWNAMHGTKYGELDFQARTNVVNFIPELDPMLDFFGASLGRTHFIKLDHGGFFPPHRDNGAIVSSPTFRVLVPISRFGENDMKWLQEDRPLKLEPGRTYFINTTKIHSVFSFVDNCTMLVLNVMATEEALNKMVRHVKTI